MKIAYISTLDPDNITLWSGTPYYMKKYLESQGLKLEYIVLDQRMPPFVKGIIKWKYFKHKDIKKGKYLFETNKLFLKELAKKAHCRLKGKEYDIIFSPGTIPTCPMSYIKSDKPMVFWTDAPFAAMVDYYPYFSNLCEESVKEGMRAEQSILDKCEAAIYSSHWAAEKAIEYYNIDPDKVKVVSFGANIEQKLSFEEILSIINSRMNNKCNLLFIGVEWERKGGDIAISVAEKLNKNGLPT